MPLFNQFMHSVLLEWSMSEPSAAAALDRMRSMFPSSIKGQGQLKSRRLRPLDEPKH